MDLERTTLKALFYDYPIELAVKNITDKQVKDDFLEIFPQLTRWREQTFSISEMRMLKHLLEDKWVNQLIDVDIFSSNICPSFIGRTLLFLPVITSEVLDVDNQDAPIVQFDQLFRWNAAKLLVGEDVLTTSFLAYKIKNRLKNKRENFVWSDTLRHDNEGLNYYLNQGLSDVHAHCNATADVFHLNWLSIMNNIEHRQFNINEDFQENAISTRHVDKLYHLKNLCVAAAFIRVALYEYIYNGKTNFDFKEVKDILEDDAICSYKISKIQASVDRWKLTALKDSKKQTLDYAIRNTTFAQSQKDNVFVIYQGERQLMYELFLRLYRKDRQVWQVSAYFYLYLLIKTRIRREIVETNSLIGFDNFWTYQERKGMFLDDGVPSSINKHFDRFVIQSVLCDTLDTLEARVTPYSLLKHMVRENENSVFGNTKCVNNIVDRLTFVAHFIKPNYQRDKDDYRMLDRDGVMRYALYREEVRRQMDYLLYMYEIQDKYRPYQTEKVRCPRLVGIDAANTEMFCRPEVFAHVYRYAALHGLTNQTYHVGEDFLDLVDGLRAIDEAILFLQLGRHSRIGHALALATNAKQYYETRYYTTTIEQQDMLDNCVWLYQRGIENGVQVPSSLMRYLYDKAAELYGIIGYSLSFDINTYWYSMLLRGDEPEKSNSKPSMNPEWEQTKLCNEEKVKAARNSADAKKLYAQYHFSSTIKQNGAKAIDEKWPREIENVVEQMQEKLIIEIRNKEIKIETNPTSNIKIGHMSKYIEHPILKFRTIGKVDKPMKLMASINTDDRGVFSTSIYNEYSLVALALIKEAEKNNLDYCREDVYKYINEIRLNGQQQRFK